MTHAGEYHGNAVFVGGIDDFLISNGSAWLNNALNAGLGSSINTVAEREEGIRGQSGAL